MKRALPLLSLASGTLLLLLLLSACPAPTTTTKEPARLIDHVDPTIGTGGFGFAYGATFLGAAVPHGLVKVGPDTTGSFGESRFLHYSGNWAEDPTVLCFSHLHLHGTGLPEGGALALMPTTSFSPDRPRATDYKATRIDEVMTPGNYKVTLQEPGIDVELTATTHAAHHRVTFPDGTADAVVVVDLARVIVGGEVDAADLDVDDSGVFVGQLHTTGSLSPPGGYTVYFAIAADAAVTTPDVLPLTGAEVRTSLHFGPRDRAHPVQLRIGLSLVDLDGAMRNLDEEIPAFGHDEVAANAHEAWNSLLSRVSVFGDAGKEASDAHEQDLTLFASALYRSFLMPTIESDVDGRWRGPDGDIHVADGFSMMTDLSLWDTYRSIQPLYALVAPERARDVALSLAAFADVKGFVPLWPMATGDAAVMIGAPAEVTVADALARGAIDTDDVRAVYAVMRAAALDEAAPVAGRGGRGDVDAYDRLGFVPTTRRASVSSTLEFSHDDQALASIAAALGESEDATRLTARSTSWRNLYDADVGFLRGKDEAGAFRVIDGEFDPTDFGDDYVEADAWQSLFPVNDIEGIEAVYGGNAGARAKLQELFELTVDDWATRDTGADTFGLSPLPFHWQGNEPSLHVCALPYDLGDRVLGRGYVDWVIDTQYGTSFEGIPGNDDGGATSAWLVEAMLGLHPIAGTDQWVLGTPRFAKVDVNGVVVENDSVGDDVDCGAVRVAHADLGDGVVCR